MTKWKQKKKVKEFAILGQMLSYPLVGVYRNSLHLQTLIAYSLYLTGSTAVGCVLSSCGSALLVLVLVRLCHRHDKSRDKSSKFLELCVLLMCEVVIIFSGAALKVGNAAVYDEVDLSPTTSSSSVIPTAPNTDYVFTTMSQTPPISTHHNVAYGNVCVSHN